MPISHVLYELQVNNETYATVNGTQKGVKLQYFPLDNTDNLSLCARYTDNATRYLLPLPPRQV